LRAAIIALKFTPQLLTAVLFFSPHDLLELALETLELALETNVSFMD